MKYEYFNLFFASLIFGSFGLKLTLKKLRLFLPLTSTFFSKSYETKVYFICPHSIVTKLTLNNHSKRTHIFVFTYSYTEINPQKTHISIIHPRCINVGLQWCTVFIADFVFFYIISAPTETPAWLWKSQAASLIATCYARASTKAKKINKAVLRPFL